MTPGTSEHIRLLLIGAGNVGRRFLQLLVQKREGLQTHLVLTFTLVGVADSAGIAVDAAGLDLEKVIALKDEGKSVADLPNQGRRGAKAVPFSVSADERTNSLVISTTPAHFALVEQLLNNLDKAPEQAERDVHYVWLDNADALQVASQLDAMYADRRGPDRPVIEADMFANALTIIAKDADLRAMQEIVEKLDKAAQDNSLRVRVGSGWTCVDAVESGDMVAPNRKASLPLTVT